MKTLQKKFCIALVSVSLGLAVSAGNVVAQSSAPPSASAHAGHEKPHGDPGKWAEKMKERMAKHQAELHDKLKITAAQEPAWKTFVEAMNPGTMPARPDRKEMEKLTTPERMEKSLEKMKEHLAKMQTRLTALKTFYAVLTPEQQKIFDERHKRMASHMRDRMDKRMGEHGHGMHKDGERPSMMDKK
ncbi:Spy/CpxP family protein refolding chaperone [Undibacterium umbellatum]|jgi:protein CpxP|uniref:Spy/CpxP family protein refolding chaperone n=1 Tax=Undibacterium umbellatum TaxID=2762300 RepID=A0ABR6ZB35_9BURK|nr:Spy/CpxP family protein refolding chaperone [Undibacterium umbellatum]MBC3908938.1 Spy/CpxP family protein refolding chaperone [Undibacterium umbellatum]